jgi:hypothetical protein
MRVLVRIVHDADDRNSVAADLPSDITIKILRRDDRNLTLGRVGRGGRTKSQRKGESKSRGAIHESISLSGGNRRLTLKM